MKKEELKEIALSSGANLIGFVDLSALISDFNEYGYNIESKMPVAISIGMSLLNSLVEKINIHTSSPVAKLYRLYNYEIVNDMLNKISFKIASFLQESGYEALPVPASPSTAGNNVHYGYFSHKAAARLSGLGWIGPSCLLITPEFGPRIRWTTILTDAPVGENPQIIESRCGNCLLCVESCPVKAFTGKPFHQEEPREARMNSIKCHEFLRRMEQEKGARVCSICVAVCPFGKNNKEFNEENFR